MRYWIINQPNGEMIKHNNKVIFFGSPFFALQYIENKLGDSKYLNIEEFKQ